MTQELNSEKAMLDFGRQLATELGDKFCLELVGDVGAGKTTLVKGLAEALGYDGVVSSPSFSLNNRYQLAGGRILSHYDFYRLDDVWSVQELLSEDLADGQTSVVIEWADSVAEVLPDNRAQIKINYSKQGREIDAQL